MRPDRLAPLLALLVLAPPAFAATSESPGAVAAAIAAAFPGRDVSIDPNGASMMPACQAALSVHAMPSQGGTPRSVAISCPAPGWTAYATVRFPVATLALVARHAIAAGAVIDATDAAWQRVPAGTVPQGNPLPAHVLNAGLHAALPIGAGEVIAAAMTDLAPTLRNGAPVILTVRASGVTITAPGRALQSGSPGTEIAVENTATHVQLRAEVAQTPPDAPGIYATPATN